MEELTGYLYPATAADAGRSQYTAAEFQGGSCGATPWGNNGIMLTSFVLGATLLAGGGHDKAGATLMLGHHRAVYAKDGTLLPWTSWNDALDREMKWYEACPTDHGYPLFTTVTFMDSKYGVIASRNDSIPAMQTAWESFPISNTMLTHTTSMPRWC